MSESFSISIRVSRWSFRIEPSSFRRINFDSNSRRRLKFPVQMEFLVGTGGQAIARLFAQPRRVWADDFRDSRRIRESKIYPAMTFLGLRFPVVGPRMLAAKLLRD